jgi:Hsp20/alpha crystallin family
MPASDTDHPFSGVRRFSYFSDKCVTTCIRVGLSQRKLIPDPAKVEAKFDKGVLHIYLPKPAEVAKKQQKIEIKA